MLTGPLPPTSRFGTWIESLELTNVDDDTYIDLSAAIEITVSLIAGDTMLDLLDDLTLRLSRGEVSLPAPGIIQWRAEHTAMSGLLGGTYMVRLIIDINGDTLVLILGSINVL